ncbi:hypothetical protein B0H11DRAFT_1913345 [Mycena galericulata]|nr:hypothetical protein B0H11DRAFT_1913345 [Mycena galericulata]
MSTALAPSTLKNFGIDTPKATKSHIPPAPKGTPAIAQFSRTLDKNTAAQLFKLLIKYRPETMSEIKAHLQAAAVAENRDASTKDSKKPLYVKFDLNHTVAFIEAKKASLVVIAHDVDPIQLVVFLPNCAARWVSRLLYLDPHHSWLRSRCGRSCPTFDIGFGKLAMGVERATGPLAQP